MTLKYNQYGMVSASTLKTAFISPSIDVAVGSTGVLATITPPQGQRVRLCFLSADSSPELGVTVSIGGVDVYNGELTAIKAAGVSGGFFGVGSYTAATVGYIDCGQDDVLQIKKDSGSTTQRITYAYQFLE